MSGTPRAAGKPPFIWFWQDYIYFRLSLVRLQS
jgi:hypothetical protein